VLAARVQFKSSPKCWCPYNWPSTVSQLISFGFRQAHGWALVERGGDLLLGRHPLMLIHGPAGGSWPIVRAWTRDNRISSKSRPNASSERRPQRSFSAVGGIRCRERFSRSRLASRGERIGAPPTAKRISRSSRCSRVGYREELSAGSNGDGGGCRGVGRENGTAHARPTDWRRQASGPQDPVSGPR